MLLLLASLILPGTPQAAVAAPTATTPPAVPTIFVKVGPTSTPTERSPGQPRAVVLIHGLSLHPLKQDKAIQARLRPWQQSDSALVRRLAQDSDVYALAYGQSASIDHIASSPRLLDHVRSLRKAGYTDVVLVGHSAGGLLARQLVEDNPRLGVTRVIQVCAPNAGSSWAGLKTARAAQIPFLACLTRTGRTEALQTRAERRIPQDVAFACVVGSCTTISAKTPALARGDGVVCCRSQWSADLQVQGIPAYPLRVTHWEAMTSARGIDLLSRLVVKPQPRWKDTRVVETRKNLLGS